MTASVGPVQTRDPIRVLVTGAGGFVGRHLITALLSRQGVPVGSCDLRVIAGVYGNLTAADLSQQIGLDGGAFVDLTGRLDIVAMDVCDPPSLRSTLSDVRPDQIFHLAARASGADVDRNAVMAVNAEGTRNLLETASLLDPVPRVLAVSTGYVYGNTEAERPARETDPVGPVGRFGAYTDSKLAMEAVVADYTAFTVVARAFAHTGPGQDPAFVVPAFARQIALMEAGRLASDIQVGNLDARRDMLDVRDVVRAYLLLMRDAEPGEIYNVASGTPIAISEILDQLRTMVPVTTRLVVDPARLRPAEIVCSTGDASKLAAKTDWHTRIPIGQTLRDTLNYWRRATAA